MSQFLYELSHAFEGMTTREIVGCCMFGVGCITGAIGWLLMHWK